MKKIYSILCLFLLISLGSTAQTVVNMNVKQNPLFEVSTNTVSLVMEGQPMTLGGDIVVTGGSGHYTYRWYKGNQELSKESTLEVNTTGEYKLDIKDQCDCLQTITFSVTGTDGIDEVLQKLVKVGPNPTEGVLSIEAPEAVKQVVIFSQAGKTVGLVNGYDVKTVDITAQPKGLYVLQLVMSSGKVCKCKVIKK